MRKLGLLCLTVILMCSIAVNTCLAGSEYSNPSTGYEVIIDDGADLLTSSEEAKLLEDMKPITQYGNVAFISVDINYSDTDDYARDRYRDLFGSSSGTI
ncbi:MAG: hypothetical protein ACI4EN_06780, partial [Butyrivibrio sp.]